MLYFFHEWEKFFCSVKNFHFLRWLHYQDLTSCYNHSSNFSGSCYFFPANLFSEKTLETVDPSFYEDSSPHPLAQQKNNNSEFSSTETIVSEIVSSKNDLHEGKKELLLQLQEKIKNFQECPLSLTALRPVFGEGPPSSDFLFVGEAPGAQEDEQGRPFVGASGQLLSKMLHSIHLHREKVFITNVVPWRPPFNRTPTFEEIQQCLPFLREYISIIKPKILVCLGSVAFHSLFPEHQGLSITKAHDLSLEYKDFSIPTFVLYHPSYLLRSSAGKPKTWEQLKKIKHFYEKI